MDKKNKNSGKFSTTTNYSHKPENSVQRRLKRPDQAFYSGGANNGATNVSGATTSPTKNTFESSSHTRDSTSGGGNFNNNASRGNRDKKPPIAATGNAMQLPPNCPPNIDSMPPRFKRKWLQENNLPLDFFEKLAAMNTNPYSASSTSATQQNSMPPPPHTLRSQTLPNKQNTSRGNRGNNFYAPNPSSTSGPNSSYHGRPSPGLRSPMRSRSRSSDQRGSRHSSRNSSLERGTRVFNNSNKSHQEMYENTQQHRSRHGTRSPDYGRRGDTKNYGNKNWNTKQNFYGNKSAMCEQSDRRDITDLPPRGKDSVIFVSQKVNFF